MNKKINNAIKVICKASKAAGVLYIVAFAAIGARFGFDFYTVTGSAAGLAIYFLSKVIYKKVA
jgi:hypothetical protein